jgi:large subunit ribosomal protein L3
MAFSPRKRAKNANGKVKFWPKVANGPQLLGFAGYKAGMTHLYYIEDRERTPEFGMEIKSAVTIIETPPFLVVGIRLYRDSYEGLEAITEIWVGNPPPDLYRKINVSNNDADKLDQLEQYFDITDEVRVITATQPRLTSVSKKKPDLMEIPIGGGEVKEQIEYALDLLGRTIKVEDVFTPGESIDVIGVTKGKGFQGPVKRWGVRILQHKSRKTKRGVASIGPWVPRRVMPQVPRPGQMGFHNRTEYNKRIMLMGNDTERVTPEGGLKNYGKIKNSYLLLKGSVMGPNKRMIKLRKGVRDTRYPEEAPSITYLHSESKIGE